MCDQPGPGEWKRLLVSAIYSHLFCDRGFTLLHSTKMSYVVAHCIYDLYVIRIKRETRWQSTYLTIWIHLKPNQCTLRRSHSTVFRNLIFISVLNHRTKRSSSKILAMERCSDQTMKGKKRIYYKKLKVYDVWETSAKIPCWWRVTSQIWVVFLIGRAAQEICFNQSETLPRISALVSQTSFHRESSGGVAKCWLFS